VVFSRDLYLKVTGSGITPIGGACQAQVAAPEAVDQTPKISCPCFDEAYLAGVTTFTTCVAEPLNETTAYTSTSFELHGAGGTCSASVGEFTNPSGTTAGLRCVRDAYCPGGSNITYLARVQARACEDLLLARAVELALTCN